ncbi:MAG: MFS transporter [Desulfobulbaceae bacterium]|nr:MFS transporter [Desulfobulbaceae bacterium]
MSLQSSTSPRQILSVSDWRSYVTLFRTNPQFTRLWLAGVISQFGNWFNYIAIFVLLQQLTGSGMAVSWFLIAKFIPTTVLGPAAGVLADRFSRKAIMIGCDLLRVGIVLSFLLIRRPEQVWMVYVLALLQESLWTFADPARRASIPNLCRPEELNVANALGGATWSIMLAFGAALGGFTTAYFGWRTAIVLDAATFLISALMVSGVTLPPLKHGKKTRPSWLDYLGLNDLREGLQYVARHRQVAALLLVKSGWALSGGILVMLTVFGEQVFAAGHGQGGNSGILYSTRGIGAAVGPLLAWRLFGESRQAMSRAIGFSFFVASGAYLLFSQAPTLAWAALFVFCGHLGGAVQWVFSTTLLQKIVEDRFRGRVFAAEMAFLTLVLSLSTYFTGAALEHGAEPRTVVLRLALLFMLPGMVWTIYRKTAAASSA